MEFFYLNSMKLQWHSDLKLPKQIFQVLYERNACNCFIIIIIVHEVTVAQRLKIDLNVRV